MEEGYKYLIMASSKSHKYHLAHCLGDVRIHFSVLQTVAERCICVCVNVMVVCIDVGSLTHHALHMLISPLVHIF